MCGRGWGGWVGEWFQDDSTSLHWGLHPEEFSASAGLTGSGVQMVIPALGSSCKHR